MKNTEINLNFINILKGMSFSQMFVIISLIINTLVGRLTLKHHQFRIFQRYRCIQKNRHSKQRKNIPK